MIFTFYKARGLAVGKSLVEEDKLELAKELETKAAAKGVQFLLPTDVVLADNFAPDANSQIAKVDAIPDGWTYEWKRKTVYGSEDPSYAVSLKRTGWTEVPASRHPEMMPANFKSAIIERKGLVLMERPQSITRRVELADKDRAREQIRFKEQQLTHAPDGQFTRDHAQAQPKIKKSYEAMPIPKE